MIEDNDERKIVEHANSWGYHGPKHDNSCEQPEPKHDNSCEQPGPKHDNPCLPPAPKTVDALIERIVFKDCQKDIQETVFKVWKNIKCIESCFVEVIDKEILTCKHKGAWVVIITYRLVVQYVTEYGFKHTVAKTVEFEKIIPFPFTKEHDDHGMIDFTKANPFLTIEKIDCIETRFKNIDSCAIIEAFVKLEIEVFATIRKAFGILTTGPVC